MKLTTGRSLLCAYITTLPKNNMFSQKCVCIISKNLFLLSQMCHSWKCGMLTQCWRFFNKRLINLLVASFHRFREVLAINNIRPWELASVFKQVLRDFLSQREYDEEDDLPVQPAQIQPMEAWTSRYKMKQGFVTPTVPNCGDHPREEIPTISGYVDRAMRHSSSFTGSNRDWDLPYYYPVPLRPTGAYSTTLWEEILLKTSGALWLTQGKTVHRDYYLY